MLKTLNIQVCEACINHVKGSCNTPGCFYIRQPSTEVPTYLEMYIINDQDTSVSSNSSAHRPA
jgi:hypothetical protein